MAQPLYPPGKNPQYLLDKRVGGLQPVWTQWKTEEFPVCRESNPNHPAHSTVAILTELSQLILYEYNKYNISLCDKSNLNIY
jgi:hypothetical protein